MLNKLVSRIKSEKISKSQPPAQEKERPEVATDSTLSQFISKVDFSNFLSSEFTKFAHEIYNPFRIPNIETAYYIPNYITLEEQDFFLSKIYSQPKEKWTFLPYAKRRLQRWGGEVTADGLKDQEALPDWLEKLSQKLVRDQITFEKKTNHVLLNEYEPGYGIMPHTDGPLYHPYVVILSMRSHTTFKFFNDYAAYKNEDPLINLLVEPMSLLIFTDKAYKQVLHCIEDKQEDVVDVVYTINEDKEIKIKSSSIDNLKMTTLMKDLEEEATRESKEADKEQLFSKRLTRGIRVSLTIRYVPEYVEKKEK